MLPPGTRLGNYEIQTQIARDARHDPERLARFKREAHVLASLNHPNIAQIYGFEEWDGRHALVMELVDVLTV